MGLISYRPLRVEDADAVFDAAREAWRFTYATIFDTVFIDQFVRTNYAPDRPSARLRAVAAQHMFFDVALDGDRIIGFCNIGVAARRGVVSDLPQVRLHWDGVGSGLLERGEHFLRTRRVPSYYCFVHKDNELGKRFYLRRGFRHLTDSDRNDEWGHGEGTPEAIEPRVGRSEGPERKTTWPERDATWSRKRSAGAFVSSTCQ